MNSIVNMNHTMIIYTKKGNRLIGSLCALYINDGVHVRFSEGLILWQRYDLFYTSYYILQWNMS